MLSELIKDFVNGAVTESGVFTTDGLKKLKALLAETTELRVFVSKSRGLGHQASSINILKRLISFGFTGDILVVYEENVHDPTVNKLAVLLPGFDPKNPGKPFSVNGVALKFVELSAVKDLTPQQLAITGGYDEKVNLATKLTPAPSSSSSLSNGRRNPISSGCKVARRPSISMRAKNWALGALSSALITFPSQKSRTSSGTFSSRFRTSIPTCSTWWSSWTAILVPARTNRSTFSPFMALEIWPTTDFRRCPPLRPPSSSICWPVSR